MAPGRFPRRMKRSAPSSRRAGEGWGEGGRRAMHPHPHLLPPAGEGAESALCVPVSSQFSMAPTAPSTHEPTPPSGSRGAGFAGPLAEPAAERAGWPSQARNSPQGLFLVRARPLEWGECRGSKPTCVGLDGTNASRLWRLAPREAPTGVVHFSAPADRNCFSSAVSGAPKRPRTRRSRFPDLALVHEDVWCRHAPGEVHLMRHEQHGHAVAASALHDTPAPRRSARGRARRVTSSNSITSGRIASERAIATRCCWPPESCRARRRSSRPGRPGQHLLRTARPCLGAQLRAPCAVPA